MLWPAAWNVISGYAGLAARRWRICEPVRQQAHTASRSAVKPGVFAGLFRFPRLAPVLGLLVVAAAAGGYWWDSVRHPAVLVALNDGPGRIAIDRHGKLKAPGEMSPRDRDAVEQALLAGRLDIPDQVIALRGTRSLVRSPQGGETFTLRAPLGTAVISDRPHFTWQPLSGSNSYRVAIFSAGFHKVMESPWLAGTEWTPAEPLERGLVYSWQVTARRGTAADAPTVRAPGLEDPEAAFTILSAAGAQQLEQRAREQDGSHLLLGILYARAGVLDLAEQEFSALARANPQSAQAAVLLEKIRAARR